MSPVLKSVRFPTQESLPDVKDLCFLGNPTSCILSLSDKTDTSLINEKGIVVVLYVGIETILKNNQLHDGNCNSAKEKALTWRKEEFVRVLNGVTSCISYYFVIPLGESDTRNISDNRNFIF